MIYLILLIFVFFLLAFAIKLFATFLLIKLFNRTAIFWIILKPILLYELGAICFFIINPTGVLDLIIPRLLLSPIVFLISVIALFFIFRFIMQKFSLLNFKKSLIIFLMIFFIITPVLSFGKDLIESKIVMKFAVFNSIEFSYESIFSDFLSQGPKSLPELILEKIGTLDGIFLQEKLLNELRNYIMTI